PAVPRPDVVLRLPDHLSDGMDPGVHPALLLPEPDGARHHGLTMGLRGPPGTAGLRVGGGVHRRGPLPHRRLPLLPVARADLRGRPVSAPNAEPAIEV